MKRRTYYTTTEYIDALQVQRSGIYKCHGKYFELFTTKSAAESDSLWLANYCKSKGIKKRKPKVVRVRFEVL
jgi:hypothetical protein